MARNILKNKTDLLLKQKTFAELETLLSEKNITKIRKIAKTIDEKDLAEWVDKLRTPQQLLFLRCLDSGTASEVFNELSNEAVEHIISNFTEKETKKLIAPLYSDDVIEVIEDLPPDLVKKVLSSSSPSIRNEINFILNYVEGTVGYEMNVNFISFKIDDLVSDLLSNLSKTDKKTPEDIIYYYIVDKKGTLIGYINLQTLFGLSDKEKKQRISKFIETDVISVRASEPREKALEKINKYKLAQLAVVDDQNNLIGTLASEDVIQLVKEEFSDDINKQAGIIQDSDIKYFESSIFKTYLSRIPWLLITLLISTFSQLIFANLFKNISQSNTNEDIDILMKIIPILPFILTIVGNVALQSTSIVIKGLILKEIGNYNYKKVLWKEIKIVFFIFLTVIVFNIPRNYFMDLVIGSTKKSGYSYLQGFVISSIIIFFSIFLAIFFSTTLPLLASRIGWDPTLMSSPLLTTFIDLLVTTVAVVASTLLTNIKFFQQL